MLKIFTSKKETESEEIKQLKAEIRNCEFLMERNRTFFDMAVDEDLIEAQIYERAALRHQYNYLLKQLKCTEIQTENIPVNIGE